MDRMHLTITGRMSIATTDMVRIRHTIATHRKKVPYAADRTCRMRTGIPHTTTVYLSSCLESTPARPTIIPLRCISRGRTPTPPTTTIPMAAITPTDPQASIRRGHLHLVRLPRAEEWRA
jgi:hypothetical protein